MSLPSWPALPLAEWQDTYATLHMWTQIVGKIVLTLTPQSNHCWNSTLHLTARGLRTRPLSCGGSYFDIEFDFVEHRLQVRRQDGATRALALAPRSVADFYGELMATLDRLDLPVRIWPVPVEVPDPIPFAEDHVHAAYDATYAARCWRILLQSARVLEEFRAGFVGKCSPVHFFWGSFDLAVTRFSGRLAPERSDADRITREAYSHEVISHGFWPGVRPAPPAAAGDDGFIHEPAFYAYAAPEPAGLATAVVRPPGAFYSAAMKEFILPYEAVRTAEAPERELRAFLDSTYERAATLARWDRSALERGRRDA
ncbi:MAG: hypothetical protein HZC24_13995 [Rhodocyclales bacterium]|nr:hypothetical protein [Rhodocyclales bacterium]